MSFFDPETTSYPRRWSEMSVEFKFMFAYHGGMMALMIAHGAVSVPAELSIAAALIAVGTIMSIRRRQALGWRWRKPRAAQWARPVVTAFFMAVFFFASSSFMPELNSITVPWLLAGLGIGVFVVMQSLQLVRLAEVDFIRDCGAEDEKTAPIAEAPWRRAVRAIFSIAFMLIWLDGVAAFYFFGRVFRGGSPVPTATETARLVDHGRAVYVTPSDKLLVDTLQTIMMIGIPSAIAGAFVIHFLLGIKLFPNTPTLRDLLKRRGTGAHDRLPPSP